MTLRAKKRRVGADGGNRSLEEEVLESWPLKTTRSKGDGVY